MAKETRRQRRDARREGGQSASAPRGRSRQQQQRPSAQPVAQQTGRRGPRERGKFVRESWGELKKVEWPGQRQVMQGTIVVIIACAIVGTYLWGADQVFRPLVRHVFLGQ